MNHEIDNADCELLGGFFTVYAHSTRMRMFCAMQQGPRTVSQIAEHAGITMQNASQHLRLMRDRGAVVTEKIDQHVYYRVADPRLVEAAQMIRQVLSDQIRTRPPGSSEPESATPEPAEARTADSSQMQ